MDKTSALQENVYNDSGKLLNEILDKYDKVYNKYIIGKDANKYLAFSSSKFNKLVIMLMNLLNQAAVGRIIYLTTLKKYYKRTR